MPKHMLREIEKIKAALIAHGEEVSENLRHSIQAVMKCDQVLAEKVMKKDIEIDRAEVELEEECLKLLALYQPVATDLRFMVAVLKINNDLERIGDHAVNVAERVKLLAEHPEVVRPSEITEMSGKAKIMLQESLASLFDLDPVRARETLVLDEEVDELNHRIRLWAVAQMQENPKLAHGYLELIGVARHLERVGDLASNIAEYVIYMVDGQIIRHEGPEVSSAD